MDGQYVACLCPHTDCMPWLARRCAARRSKYNESGHCMLVTCTSCTLQCRHTHGVLDPGKARKPHSAHVRHVQDVLCAGLVGPGRVCCIARRWRPAQARSTDAAQQRAVGRGRVSTRVRAASMRDIAEHRHCDRHHTTRFGLLCQLNPTSQGMRRSCYDRIYAAPSQGRSHAAWMRVGL